ncbi:MAG: Single-stranded DNA-binding protein [Syntrophomonadaceae bacterium]|nr:Single-stranded DNA-binding protein [Bacillota bacterium]
MTQRMNQQRNVFWGIKLPKYNSRIRHYERHYDKIILAGNLTRDPEVRYTPKGTPVATFGLAVNSRFKAKSAETTDLDKPDEKIPRTFDDEDNANKVKVKDEALFVNVIAFNKHAESVGQYLTKGNKVLIDGRLTQISWEKDGEKKYKYDALYGDKKHSCENCRGYASFKTVFNAV